MSAIPRNEGEDFAAYKERRAADHEATKKALKGVLSWDSYYEGTYYNPERASKKAQRVQATPYMKSLPPVYHY